MKIILKNITIILLFSLFSGITHAKSEKEIIADAEYYFLIDPDTKEVLLSKNADTRIAPSSMTKLMTAYVVFDRIKNGKISLNNQCMIGKDAWRKGGSSMFLNYGDVVSIDDLLKGLLIVSGNDAAIALAETVAGGYDNFISLMNFKAKELGMDHSHFANPHGLNEDGHYMSLRDLATLTIRLYEDFPEYTDYMQMRKFTYGKITQPNRHPLIKKDYEGMLGGKTGHTNDGGYGVVAVVKRNNRKLIAVINKTKTPRQRSELITAIMDYGFQNYKKVTIFKKGQTITNLETWLGDKVKVPVIANKDISFNMPREDSIESVRVIAKYNSPIYAPIDKNQEIAKLSVKIPGYKDFTYPLFAKERITKVGLLRKIKRTALYKLSKIIN